MDLDAVADELYGLRPEDFTAARDERAAAAREAGDRALAEKISKLRRPSLSAWAGNLLVREQPEEVEPLLRLGEGLRQAHRELNGGQLRELSRRQRTLITTLSRQARRLAAEAGHPISDDVQHEVEDTLHAVLADPRVAQEWAAGRLVKPFSAPTGFPAAQGAPPPAPAPQASPPAARRKSGADQQRRRRLAEARQEAEEAERELRALEDGAAAAERAADDAKELVGRLQQRIGELTEELNRVEDERRQARAAEQEARERARSADHRAREARRRARTAAARAERLAAKDRGT